jgi:hypothetical protein
MKRARTFLARVEALERREVLSTVHPAAHAAGQVVTVTVTGSGNASVVSSTVLSTGGIQVVDRVSGQASGIGTFAGTATSLLYNVGKNYVHVDSVAVMTGQNGQQIDASASGNYRVRGTGHPSTSFNLSWVVGGGTKAFANAVGRGVARNTIDFVTGVSNFTFSGKVHL